jgi:hypothetical protein
VATLKSQSDFLARQVMGEGSDVLPKHGDSHAVRAMHEDHKILHPSQHPPSMTPSGSAPKRKEPAKLDEFEVALHLQGLTLLDVDDVAQEYVRGDKTKFGAVCYAWITAREAQPFRGRVAWCVVENFDFDRRYTEAKELESRGLLGSTHVNSYREYIDALRWKRECEALTRGAERTSRPKNFPEYIAERRRKSDMRTTRSRAPTDPLTQEASARQSAHDAERTRNESDDTGGHIAGHLRGVE